MKCEDMDFFAEKLQITDTFQELRKDASVCDFCKMRWRLGEESFSNEVQSILFDLVDSELQLNQRPVISFLACHEDPGAFLRRWGQNLVYMPSLSMTSTNTKSF